MTAVALGTILNHAYQSGGHAVTLRGVALEVRAALPEYERAAFTDAVEMGGLFLDVDTTPEQTIDDMTLSDAYGALRTPHRWTPEQQDRIEARIAALTAPHAPGSRPSQALARRMDAANRKAGLYS